MKPLTISLIFFLIGCSFQTKAQEQIRKLSVEPNHSTIGFSISIAGFSKVTGKFSDYTIEIDWNENNVEHSTISAVIQAASIQTGIDGRDEHLRSSDFFGVEEFPEITFTSNAILKTDHGFLTLGQFTMHGKTHEIEIPFEIVKQDGNTIGFSGKTSIKRSDYDLGLGFKHDSMPDFLSDEINVSIDFWTKKRKVKKVE